MESVSLIVLSLVVYFGYHLLNKTEAGAWLVARIPLTTKIRYALACVFCLSFHLTIVSWVFLPVPFYYVFCVPVINLLIDKVLE